MTQNLRAVCGFRFILTFFAALLIFVGAARARQDQQQQPPPGTSTPAQTQTQVQAQPAEKPADQSAKPPDKPAQKDDRIFGVMPNHLTVEGGNRVPPLTWKEKYKITAEGAFDPYEFVIVGVVAGIHQAENQDAPFGQGAQGYAKRYGAGFADQAIGNMMTGAVFPSLLRTDPRYFRLGEGSIRHRLGYSVGRIFITRTDSGHRTFNLSEFAGSAAGAGISNAYYPSSDRTISNNVNTWATQIAIDAFGNVLKEFWPDIHHKLQKK